MQQIYTKGVLAGELPHKFNAFFFHYTHWLRCLIFPYLTAKDFYRLCEFLSGTLINMQPEVWNIETFKMFKTKF